MNHFLRENMILRSVKSFGYENMFQQLKEMFKEINQLLPQVSIICLCCKQVQSENKQQHRWNAEIVLSITYTTGTK